MVQIYIILQLHVTKLLQILSPTFQDCKFKILCMHLLMQFCQFRLECAFNFYDLEKKPV